MSENYCDLYNPVGSYFLIPFNGTMIISLKGSDIFREKAYNLFSTFGGESDRGKWMESRKINIHPGTTSDSCYFFLPRNRIFSALKLYLYGQLYLKAPKKIIYDEENDPIDWICECENELMQEAERFANKFMQEEMICDCTFIPGYYYKSISTAYNWSYYTDSQNDFSDIKENILDHHDS